MKLFHEDIFIQDTARGDNLLQQSIDSFYKLFHTSPGGMCMTENSMLVDINPAYEACFGYSRGEALGRTGEELGILPFSEAQRLKHLIRVKGQLQNEEARCRNKAGNLVHCLITTLPVLLGDKQFTLTSFTNVTHLKLQNDTMARQHKDLSHSLNYARHIQDTLFPARQSVSQVHPRSFVLFRPKHTVSGDFYWTRKISGKLFLAVADCTGEGVSGALMSVIGYTLLDKLSREETPLRPCDILNQLSLSVHKTLWLQTGGRSEKEYIDISLISVDMQNMVLEYAGARRPVYRIRNNELLKLSPDRFPIGAFNDHGLQAFSNQRIPIQRGDTIYLFTDGYSDQFGGPERKKFKSLSFQQFLLSIQDLSMEEQKQVLEEKIDKWKGEYEQVDDIMVIGIKI